MLTKCVYFPLFFLRVKTLQESMALRKYLPSDDASSVAMKPLNFSSRVHGNAQLADSETSHTVEPDVDIDLREVYFLIMHFLSVGPCHKTCGHFWNELLEHQLLPRRYHAWYSRNGVASGHANDDGMSFPLSYNNLVERYTICFLYCFNICDCSINIGQIISLLFWLQSIVSSICYFIICLTSFI